MTLILKEPDNLAFQSINLEVWIFLQARPNATTLMDVALQWPEDMHCLVTSDHVYAGERKLRWINK